MEQVIKYRLRDGAMDFFGMGTGEIILIIIIALIIWGPSKLPEMAKKLAKGMTTLKQTSSSLTAQLRKELEEEEMVKKTPPPPTPLEASQDKKTLPQNSSETPAAR